MAVLFHTQVYSWSDSRDSGRRITNLDHAPTYHREFIINPYFISELKTHTKGSTFKYSENIGDRREGTSTIVCDHTVAAIKAHADTTANSNFIKLPIYINNNRLNSTVDTTINWATISYADRYNPNPENTCWVVYNRGSYKRVEVLVALAIEDIVKLTVGGNTTATFSTTFDFPGL